MGGYAGVAEPREHMQQGYGIGAAAEADDDGLSRLQERVLRDVGLDGGEHEPDVVWFLLQSSSRNDLALFAESLPASMSLTSFIPELMRLTISSSFVTGVSLNAPRREIRRTDSP